MERLTERDEYGNADIIALSDMMPKLYAKLSYSETNALTDALNRLAAYEDTGLEPEEVEALKKGTCAGCSVPVLGTDRIRELAQAEAALEGLL
ncbi:hypothetical protein [uncultured Dysosmobacter sp.]|uniref:hypothetical protein n=1 Tax=uncultured Dysosmobacter sp. TaxID=2591384 RepID=UPI002619449B|nr:hypothetical protein [uncultured Dysosmobacter sp.]